MTRDGGCQAKRRRVKIEAEQLGWKRFGGDIRLVT